MTDCRVADLIQVCKPDVKAGELHLGDDGVSGDGLVAIARQADVALRRRSGRMLKMYHRSFSIDGVHRRQNVAKCHYSGCGEWDALVATEGI